MTISFLCIFLFRRTFDISWQSTQYVDKWMVPLKFNTLRLRQNGRRFADDTFIRIFLNENVRISIKISLKSVLKGPINNIPALVQIMAWRWSGDKSLSEPMTVSLLTHMCVTRPQWVKQHILNVLCSMESLFKLQRSSMWGTRTRSCNVICVLSGNNRHILSLVVWGIVAVLNRSLQQVLPPSLKIIHQQKFMWSDNYILL